MSAFAPGTYFNCCSPFFASKGKPNATYSRSGSLSAPHRPSPSTERGAAKLAAPAHRRLLGSGTAGPALPRRFHCLTPPLPVAGKETLGGAAPSAPTDGVASGVAA